MECKQKLCLHGNNLRPTVSSPRHSASGGFYISFSHRNLALKLCDLYSGPHSKMSAINLEICCNQTMKHGATIPHLLSVY